MQILLRYCSLSFLFPSHLFLLELLPSRSRIYGNFVLVKPGTFFCPLSILGIPAACTYNAPNSIYPAQLRSNVLIGSLNRCAACHCSGTLVCTWQHRLISLSFCFEASLLKPAPVSSCMHEPCAPADLSDAASEENLQIFGLYSVLLDRICGKKFLSS